MRDHGMLDVVVDPVRLAHSYGVRIFNAKFGERDMHGLLAIRSGKASIYVEASDSPARKRFTIAHELGHYLLHYRDQDVEHIDTSDNFRTVLEPDAHWTEDRRREWEANAFAAALLMPSDLVQRVWPEVRDLDGMAAWFQVSPKAMAIRLEELRLGD